MKRITMLLGAGILFFCSTVLAAVPQLINFQGILRDGSGNLVVNASYSVTFSIYDVATGGTNLWTETQSVTTVNGLFSVLLGSSTPVLDSVFNDSSRWLGVKVGADPEMTPRQKLSSVGYSHNSSEWTSAAQDLFRLSGNVGIGTVTPQSRLHAENGNAYSLGGFSICGIIGEAASNLGQEKYGVVGAASGTGPFGYGVRGEATTTGTNYGVYGYASGGATNWAGYFSGDVYSSGNVGIGTTSPSAKLHVKGAGFPNSFGNFDTDAASQDAGLRFQEAGVVKSHLYHQANTNTLNLYGEGFSGLSVTSTGSVGIGTTAPAALLHVNGTAGNNTGVWSNLSDRRLKKDIEPIQNALQTVEQLRPVIFRWKDEGMDKEFGRVRGLIAQDVEKVIPEWIKTDPDGYKRIEPIGVDALLIEAIKELKAENEELKNRILRLEKGDIQAQLEG